MDTSSSSQQGGNNDSIILEEEIDPNYVPTEEEVQEYASWMGMDAQADRDLFWIAREGLMAPLPKNWKPCKTKDSGDIYYFNFQTSESSWDHPCDGYYKRLYEEEKKKKETQKKAESDVVRAKARQDVDQLLGRNEAAAAASASSTSSSSLGKKAKSSSKTSASSSSKSATALAPPKVAGGGLPPSGGLQPLADKKALPGIRGKDATQARPLTAPAAISTTTRSAVAATASSALADFDDSDSSPQPKGRGDAEDDDAAASGSGAGQSSSKRVTSRLRSSITESETYKSPVIAKSKSVLSGVNSLTASFPGSSSSSSSDSKDRGAGVVGGALRSKTPLAAIGDRLHESQGTTTTLGAEAKDAWPVRRNDEMKVSTHGATVDAQLQRAEADLQILRAENARLEDTLSRSKAEFEDLSAKRASTSQALEKESKTNEALLSAQNLLQMQCNSCKEEAKAIRAELNKEIERRAKLDAELREVQQQWSNTKKENEVHKKTIGELRDSLHAAECEISQLASPSLNRSGGALHLEDTDGDLEKALMRVRSEKSDAERALLGAEKSLVALKAERDSVSEELERLRISFQQRTIKLEQEAEDYRREVAARRLENGELAVKLAASEKMLEEMRSRPASAMAPISVSGPLSNEDERDKRMLSELQVELEGERAKSKRLDIQAAALREEVTDLESRLAQSRRRSTELEGSCDASYSNCRSLEARLAAEVDGRHKLDTQLRSLEEDMRELERAVHSKEAARLAALEEAAALRGRCHDLEVQLQVTSTDAIVKDSKIAKLEHENAVRIEGLHGASNSSGVSSATSELLLKLEAAHLRQAQLEADLRVQQRRVSGLETELAQSQQLSDNTADSEWQAKASLREALNKIRDLEAASESMNARLAKAIAVGNQRDNINSLRDTSMSPDDTLRSRLGGAEQETQTLLARLARLDDDLLNARRSVETADKMYRDAENHLATSREQVSQLRSEQIQDRTLLYESQLQLEKCHKKIAALEAELQEVLKEHSLNKENHRVQREKLESLLLESSSRLELERSKLNDETARERARAEAFRSEASLLQERIKKLEAQITSISKEKHEFSIRCEELSLLSRPVSSNGDISTDSLRVTLGEKLKEISVLSARIRTLEEENRRLTVSLDARSAELDIIRRSSTSVPAASEPRSSSTEVLASMMESYKAQMDAALKEQQAATAALRAHIEDTLSAPSIRAVSAPARKTSRAKPVAPPNDSPTDMIKRDSFDAESDSISSSAGSDIGIPPPKGLSTPIATLRRKLTHFAHQQQEGLGAAAQPGLGALPERLKKERKLLDEILIFIKSENDYIRKKQRKLAVERDKWRSLYTGNVAEQSGSETMKIAKKASRDALNKRAEDINRMIDQIRSVQVWLEARESKLVRLESLSSLQSTNKDESFAEHMKTLDALNFELENDLSYFRDGASDRNVSDHSPFSDFYPSDVRLAPDYPSNMISKTLASTVYGNRLAQGYIAPERSASTNSFKPHSDWLDRMRRDISSFQPQQKQYDSSQFLAHTNLIFSKENNLPFNGLKNGVKKAVVNEPKLSTFKV